jgi:XTP/dITP diphosphohydrolase
MKKLLVATTNPGKFNEFRIIIGELAPELQIVSLRDLDIKNKIEETGSTFEENAGLKAKFYCGLTGLPALADDSGLEIDYLNGEPGVLSRRWPGYEATDGELIEITLRKLRGVPKEKRGAQLRAVIALAMPGEEKVHFFEGVLRGFITEKIAAPVIPGFPFRSILFVPERRSVLAELTAEEEAAISHRKIALKQAKPLLEKL